jgi:hypothetical protein
MFYIPAQELIATFEAQKPYANSFMPCKPSTRGRYRKAPTALGITERQIARQLL